MRNRILLFVLVGSIAGCSSQKSNSSLPIMGKWEASSSSLQIREKKSFLNYRFILDTVPIALIMDSNRIISGKIGQALVNESPWKINRSLQEGDASRIFATAKLQLHGIISKKIDSTHQLELWAMPLNNDTIWDIEVRERHGFDATPVGLIHLKKRD